MPVGKIAKAVKGVNAYSAAAKETSYLYRGVAAGHPAIDAARQEGRVLPGSINGTVFAETHNLGGQAANNPFTSWTRDPAIASTHAGKMCASDDCFELAWALLYLIETSPSRLIENALDGGT